MEFIRELKFAVLVSEDVYKSFLYIIGGALTTYLNYYLGHTGCPAESTPMIIAIYGTRNCKNTVHGVSKVAIHLLSM